MTDVSSLARDLVAVPSHDDPTACGDRIEAWLREHVPAASVERDGVGNVLARAGHGDALAFVGHHDVVPPDASQVTEEGYAVETRDGRLYGRGSADMKGALAAAMVAFRDAVAARDGTGQVAFASFVGEETGGEGARHAVDRGFVPRCAVVGEGSTGYSAPGVTDVAVAHRGRRASTLVASGEAAHASEAGAGANAIYRACDAVDVLRELAVPEATVLGHELSGSLAVTEMHGGDTWNVVPDRCAVTVDERTVPGHRADLAAVEGVPGVTWQVDQDWPPMRCSDPDFADAVLHAAAAAQDGDPARVVKPHATDAGWLAEAGAACVVCGPAERGEAHTADESVSLAALERCARLYRTAFERWDGAP